MIPMYFINKYYKDKIILDNINLDIESSNIYMILGKSGAGKSTLLNIIGLLDTPNSGNISIKGKVIKNNEIKFDDYTWECTNPEIGG